MTEETKSTRELYRRGVQQITLPLGVISAPDSEAAANQYLKEKYHHERVIVVGDMHLNTDVNTWMGIELAKKTGKSLGLEVVDPPLELALEYARQRKITLPEFQRIASNYYPGFGTFDTSKMIVQSYLGSERAIEFFDSLYYAAYEGVKIYGLASQSGSVREKNFDLADRYLENQVLNVRINYDVAQKFKKMNVTSQTAEASYNGLLQDLESRNLSDLQHIALRDAKEFLSNRLNGLEQDLMGEDLRKARAIFYNDAIRKLLKIGHNDYLGYMKNNTKLVEAMQDMDSTFNAEERLQRDPELASKIASMIGPDPKSGMVVVYGLAHTLGNDNIELSLREQGISTAHIIPYGKTYIRDTETTDLFDPFSCNFDTTDCDMVQSDMSAHPARVGIEFK